MSSGFAHIFGQIVSIREKLLSSTNLEASGHIKREKALFLSTCVALDVFAWTSLYSVFAEVASIYANVLKQKKAST